MAGPLLSLKYLQCTFSFFGYAGSSLLQGLFSSYGEPSYSMGFSDNSVGKESPCRAGDLDWEDSLEKEMATHSSILAWRMPMDRGAWQTTVHGVTKSQTQLSD